MVWNLAKVGFSSWAGALVGGLRFGIVFSFCGCEFAKLRVFEAAWIQVPSFFRFGFSSWSKRCGLGDVLSWALCFLDSVRCLGNRTRCGFPSCGGDVMSMIGKLDPCE